VTTNAKRPIAVRVREGQYYRLLGDLLWERDHPIRQVWSHFYRRRTQTVQRVTRHPNVIVIRLRTAREARRFSRTMPTCKRSESG